MYWSHLMLKMLVCVVLCLGGVSRTYPLVIDHRHCELERVPTSYIEQACHQFRIWYGHTSHGSQITSGMAMLSESLGAPFLFNETGSHGALMYYDGDGGDLGHNGDLAWVTTTQTVLNMPDNPYNMVIWSWCGGVSDNDAAGIDAYLQAMDALEQEYPEVVFVYMTGHLDGTGVTGNLHVRNNQIRAYCQTHNKLLFDFADIESYDPDGNYFLDQYADDYCYYNGGSNNWAQEWCAANPGQCPPACSPDEQCAHSECINCLQKSRAFWWMMAQLAGWTGDTNTPQPTTSTPNPTGEPTATPTLSPIAPTPTTQTGHIPQPNGFTGFHRSGQTFLTWNECTDIQAEQYRVYRHTAPINATNLNQAQLLATLPKGSSIYHTERQRAASGNYPPESNGGYVSLRNYIIEPQGEQLNDTTGMFVWTTHETQLSYFAITTVLAEIENQTDFSSQNTLTGIEEQVSDPEPVLVWSSSNGLGHVFTQYMDFSRWNPTFEVPEALTYAYNYFVGLPRPEGCEGVVPASRALLVHIEGYGTRYEAGTGSNYFCAVELWCDDPRQSWYYGYSATHNYWNEHAPVVSGPIVNFTEERIQRSIFDTLQNPEYQIDPQRIYCYGQSMGGSGSLSLGLRYPNVFAAVFCGQPMTNYATAYSWHDHDLIPRWGALLLNLPIENRGVYASHLAQFDGIGVWDWMNHHSQMVVMRGSEAALIGLNHGNTDDVIVWDTQGQLGYEPFYLSNRAFSGAVIASGHAWLGFEGQGPTWSGGTLRGQPFWDFQVIRNETVPGLTYASGSLPVPPVTVGTYNTNLDWSASWNAWDGSPVDQSDVWQISLRSLSQPQTVDITPRRVQLFPIVPDHRYYWENRAVSNNQLIASGTQAADADGLLTIPSFTVSEIGNRCIIRTTNEPILTPPPTEPPIITPTLVVSTTTPIISTKTPTPGSTDLTTIIFQQGTFPDTSYAGCTDVVITSLWEPNTQLGYWEMLDTYRDTEEAHRILIRFDLTTIPSGVEIIAASLELYTRPNDDAPDNQQQEVAMYIMLQEWVEGTGFEIFPDPLYIPDGATWQLAGPNTPWETIGGDFNTNQVSSTVIPPYSSPRWMTWDALYPVRNWVQHPNRNYGVILRTLGTQYCGHRFHSKDSESVEAHPRLSVTYRTITTPTSTPTADPTPSISPTPTVWHPVSDKDYDLNNDNRIGPSDLLILLAALGNNTPDFNGDGRTDWHEVLLMSLKWHLVLESMLTNTPTPLIIITTTPINTVTDIQSITPTGTPPPNTTSLQIPLQIYQSAPSNTPQPVTVGIPLPQGAWDPDHLTIRNQNGPIPCQIRGMVKIDHEGQWTWVLADFQANESDEYYLTEGLAPSPELALETTSLPGGGYEINTHSGRWQVLPHSGLIGHIWDASGTVLVEEASWGTASAPATIEQIEHGPLRAMFEVRAQEAFYGLDLTARIHFYAGQPFARLQITVTNYQRCAWGNEVPLSNNAPCGINLHQPACNGLDSAYSVVFDDLTWSLNLDNPPIDNELIYQDSSGTDRWDYYVGQEPRMQSGVTRRGYTHHVNDIEVATGDQADATIHAGGINVFVPYFAQQFPKALRIRDGRVEVGLFPAEFANQHILRAMEQKTHEVWIGLDETHPMPWQTRCLPAYEWMLETQSLGLIGPRIRGGVYENYEAYLDAQFDDSTHVLGDCNNNLGECATSLPDAQSRFDYFGWTDFGDIPLDYEDPRSPMNLKYDVNLGFIAQWFRTGNEHWWEWALTSNRHFADIDILHSRKRGYLEPRAWFEGGTIGHSQHNETGIDNPHRNCENPAPDLSYGVAGMSAWALLTGDSVVREAALEVADNMLWRIRNSNDSQCEIEAWGGGSGEGYMGAQYRSVANAGRMLLWAWKLTGNSDYLDGTAGITRWYHCEMNNLPECVGWKDALLARAIGEYILACRQFQVTPEGSATATLETLLQRMSSSLIHQNDRAWFRECGGTGPEINAWMLLAADCFALGYGVTNDQRWLDDYATPCFNTGQRDPYYEGDYSQYHSTKEFVNTVGNGFIYLAFASALLN